jgi:hypothetical protein
MFRLFHLFHFTVEQNKLQMLVILITHSALR